MERYWLGGLQRHCSWRSWNCFDKRAGFEGPLALKHCPMSIKLIAQQSPSAYTLFCFSYITLRDKVVRIFRMTMIVVVNIGWDGSLMSSRFRLNTTYVHIMRCLNPSRDWIGNASIAHMWELWYSIWWCAIDRTPAFAKIKFECSQS